MLSTSTAPKNINIPSFDYKKISQILLLKRNLTDFFISATPTNGDTLQTLIRAIIDKRHDMQFSTPIDGDTLQTEH